MVISNIISWSLLVIMLFVAFYALLNIIKFLLMFHARRCRYCGHVMVFKKHCVEKNKDFYDFHCEHCGAWERVSKEDMFSDDGEDKISVA